LGEDVERRFGDLDFIDDAGRDAAPRGRGFQDVVAILGDHHALGCRARAVPGTADALQRWGEAARSADDADPVDEADIDAQFQTRTAHDCPHFARAQARFDPVPLATFERAVMDPDAAGVAPFAADVFLRTLVNTSCVRASLPNSRQRCATRARGAAAPANGASMRKRRARKPRSSTNSQGRPGPLKNSPIRFSGATVADRPTRTGRSAASASSDSRHKLR
jgi:hypothetical protein